MIFQDPYASLNPRKKILSAISEGPITQGVPVAEAHARARELLKGLRCLVCQNENIDDSNAALARDLRLLVRERLVAGDSDEEVIAYLVDRYGEFVLLSPTTGGWNWLLWAAGPLLFVAAAGGGAVYLRGRARADAPTEARLDADEERRLREILDRPDREV